MQDYFQSYLKQSKDKFSPNYESNYGCIARRVFMWHTFKQVMLIRHIVQHNKQQGKQTKKILHAEQVPNIRPEDDCLVVGEKMFNVLRDITKDKQHIEQNDVFKMMLMVFQSDIIRTMILFLIQAILKMSFSILLKILLETVSQSNYRTAYILAAISGLTWFLSQIARHNAFYEAPIISGKIRSGFIFLMFRKLSKQSQFSVKSHQAGKIINLLSNDFNLIQLKAPIFFAGSIFPVSFTGITIILFLRLGWPALCGIILSFLLIPLQFLVGKTNGNLLQSVNKYKDKRLKTCSQIIDGIKFIKLYGWQIAFKKIIQALRHKEIKNYYKLSMGRALERSLANISSVWAGLLSFTVMYFAADDHFQLNTAIIYSTLQLMVFLRLQIFFCGVAVGFFYELKIIVRRLIDILQIKSMSMIRIDPITKIPISQKFELQKSRKVNQSCLQICLRDESVSQLCDNGQIIFRNFQGYWTQNLQTPNLKNINIHFHKNKFYGITGKIGAGKSGLLGVMLKEIPYYSGEFCIAGSISYVEQQPVIFSNTIKNNILYCKKYDEHLYNEALNKSCLEADLQLLEHGDKTLVGEKGVTLSGGQKARLALARAIYADAEFLLLDDPISAVDSKVARQIYNKVIKGYSGTKTIILVTHQIAYLEECDQIIIMDDGKVTALGNFKQLKTELQILSKSEHDMDQEQEDQEQIRIQEQLKQEMRQQMVRMYHKQKDQVVMSQSSYMPVIVNLNKEEHEVEVTFKSYLDYISYTTLGTGLFVFTILLFIISEGLNTTYIRLLSFFDSLEGGNSQLFDSGNMQYYWGIMWLLTIMFFVTSIFKFFLLNTVVLFSNEKIHQNMVHALVRSPSQYFDTTPSGRLVNNFSNDLGIIDNSLAFILTDSIEGPIISIIMLVNIFQINLFFIPFGVVNCCILVIFFILCKNAIVQSKQMDLRTKSPMFNIMSQTINGLIQVHIYNRRDSLLREFSNAVNNALRSNLCFWLTNRAFGTYVSYCSIMVLICGFIIGVYNITTTQKQIQIATGQYGISVVFLVYINDYLQWFLRQVIGMESIMVSVERSFHITQLPSQGPLRTDYDIQIGFKQQIQGEQQQSQQNTQFVRANWPVQPSIRIQDMSMRYREGLPLVLRNVSFQINSNEKVGIVGRTGAGKSSIIQALFRIVEAEKGTYKINDYDAKKMGLHSLRQHISVIPQTPFIFKGTVLQNLDPFNKSTTDELWKALQESNLQSTVRSLPDQMETMISSSTDIFSVGQKQLLCLARALLRRNRILVLDQATSNVDMQTDDFIQKVLKEKFKNTTVITIAHRLNTIADYDKLIVMNRGRVVEVGSPHELINSNGLFSEMVSHTGKNANNIINTAKKAYEKKYIK